MGNRTRVLIAYSEVTGYAMAGWKALTAREDIELKVLAGGAGSTDRDNAFLASGDCPWLSLLEGGHRACLRTVRETARAFRPEVVFVSGWSNPAYAPLVREKTAGGYRVVMCLDTGLHRPLRQILGRVRLWNYLQGVDRFLVPGERGREFLNRWWRVPNARIWTGLYAADVARWGEALEARRGLAAWPRSFQFIGRYIPIKGVQELLAGYRAYRSEVADPMEFRFCGHGPLGDAVRREPGVADLGFVQPNDLGPALGAAGCFVLPSRYDPWAVALVEACAAGLPVIAGVSCGASVEVLRDGYNGALLREVSAGAVRSALTAMHHAYEEWPRMGERSAGFAAPYAPERWAANVARLAQELAGKRMPAPTSDKEER